MLDREESGFLTLQVCTKQIRPLANFNSKNEKQGRELFLGINNANILKETAQSTITFPPVPDKVTPAAISVQSISPQVRSLPPSALLRERLHIVGSAPTLEGDGPLTVTGPIEKPFLSRKENSFGRLLASRRLLSQGKQLFRDDVNNTRVEEGHTIAKREAFNNKKLNKIIDKTLNNRIEIRNNSRTPCATIRLTLLDANDNNPVFIPSNHYEFVIMDDIEEGEVVGTVKAVDNDSGVNGVVKYKLQKQAQEDDSDLSSVNQFIMDEKTGVLRVTSLVTAGEVTLFVEGSDSPSSPSETRTSLAIVSITVLEFSKIKSYNSFEPQFIGAPYDFWVGADAPIGTSVGQIRVAGTDDRDIVFDMFHSYNEVVPFGIEETSGIVAVTKALQDFTRSEYKLEAFVLANLLNKDQNYFELSTNVTIHVAPSSRASSKKDIIIKFSVPVEDLNDNPPQFNAVKYEGYIEENSPRGTKVTDLDSYEGSFFNIHLIGNSTQPFNLIEDSNEIMFNGEVLDREEKASYHFILNAIDDGNLKSTANLTITVEDTNDNPPEFIMRTDDFEPRVSHGKSTFREINIPGNVWNITEGQYSTLSIPESIPNPNQDQLLFTRKLQPNNFYLLNITASDNGGLETILNIPVYVYDVNDKPPKFKQPSYTFQILEGEYVVSEIGSVFAEDQDSGDNGELIYSIVLHDYEDADSLPFRIVEATGKVLLSGNIDREKQEKYEFTVQAEDGGIPPLSDFAKVIVLVEDVNDHPPEFVDFNEIASATDGSFHITPLYRASIEETAPPGSVVTKIRATDLDSNKTSNGIILYKLLNSSSLAIDSQDGTIYTINRLDL
ncbi:Cadherin EGF LAG seven-pass G-type receptor 2 [Armadillidium vulgare]|nr:Cadherin EGF LAG seven-pass G-type receptor 2 [Armadillidium vulgare]